MQKEGTHPIVYPAAGSHATFYDSAVYIENGQHGSGVGCDNTTEPLRELRPRPVLMPETASEQRPLRVAQLRRPLGRKGKGLQQRADRAARRRRSGANRSPGWRSSARPARACPAARSPARRSPAPSAAPSPRSRTSSTSRRSRGPLAIATLVVLAVLIALFVGLTRWRPVDLDRAAGQALLRPAGPRRAPALRPPLAGPGPDRPGGAGDRRRRPTCSPACSPAAARPTRPPGARASTWRSPTWSNRSPGRSRWRSSPRSSIVFVRLLVRIASRPASAPAGAACAQRFWRVVGAQLLATLGVLPAWRSP